MPQSVTAQLESTAPSNAAVQGQQDQMAATTAQQNSSTVKPQCLYVGVVNSVDVETRRLTVKIGDDVTFNDCMYLSGVLAPLLGVGSAALPAPGTKVLVMHTTGETYVIGAVGGKPEAIRTFKGRAGADVKLRTLESIGTSMRLKRTHEKLPDTPGATMAGDVLPGEEELTNNLGVAIRVLQNFAQLSAGGLAKVETCLLNDMVRISDNYFAHHSCAGDDLIWTNGYTTDEEQRTSYQYEADGKLNEQDSFAVDGRASYDPVDTAKKKADDEYSATGRWRMSRYKGFLGDFIHTFVTNPAAVQSTYHQGAMRGGNFRSWVGADGTFMVQAAGGIHLEVRKNISIPHILKVWNDPNFDIDEAYRTLNSTYLRIWGINSNWNDLVVSCWQMRNYARYITLFHSLERFLQLEEKGLCKVYGEAGTKPNSAVAAEGDKAAANSNKAYIGHASITIDAGGSITMQQGSTTSVILNQGNVQIAAPGNIELVAGGTISLKGKHVVSTSALDTEISSTHGKLTMRSKNSMKFLAEKGRMWFKCDAERTPAEGLGYSSDEGDDFSPFTDKHNKKELEKYAIIFDTAKGRMLLHSKDELTIASESGDVTAQAEKGKVFVGGKKQVQIVSEGSSYESPDGDTPETRETGSVLIHGDILGFNAKQVGFQAEGFKVNKNILVTEGVVNMQSNVRMSGVVQMDGGMMMTGSIRMDGSVQAKGGFTGPSEHVAPNDEIEPVELEEIELDAESIDEAVECADKLTIKDDGSNYKDVEMQGPGAEWAYRDDYELTSNPGSWKSLKRPFYEDAINNGGYDNSPQWRRIEWSQTKLEAADRTNTSKGPWPGIESSPKKLEFNGGLPVLTQEVGKQNASVIKKLGDLTPTGYYWYGLKDTGGGSVDVLYRFKSISRATEAPTGP